ncbi:mitogen-activated protein kinase kinase kinase 1-like [Vitis riparia]|uniref:mitogen-activated protein kinase kinase kinase 1-like n=1 Tax=Vitis riparia TaxID=96939 RepID=UPI00155A8797|nr:mitogen-activated protein kinase kinase kinase 1-like [Vitis riparia]
MELDPFYIENMWLLHPKFGEIIMDVGMTFRSTSECERLQDETKLCIFLELAPEGSLLNLYRKHKLLEPQVSEYTRQILNGLSYLHGKHVIHRDVKCANILVFENHIVKLADFGLSKHCQSNDFNSSKGSPFWTAPEVVNAVYRKNDCYGLAADIWSLGCTVLEMLTQQHPYPQYEWMQALFRIGHGELPFVPDSLSIDARDFILKCLQVNPSDRPTARQLLDHPFVKSPLHPFIGPASPRANGIRP